LIRRVSEARCAAATAAPYIILVVPLLLESGAYRTQVQRILVVDCYEETQVSRVVARSGLTHDEARAIMAAQVSRAQRLAAADDVILNTGDRAGLDSQIQLFDQRYRALAASL